MTAKKVFMDNKSADIVCPRCGKFHRLDAAPYRSCEHPVRIEFTCEKCGNVETLALERRSHYRVETRKPGTYGKTPDCKDGTIMVMDLSRTGIRVELDKECNIAPGDRLFLEFTLPNSGMAQKEIIVVQRTDRIVRAEFVKPLDLPPAAVV